MDSNTFALAPFVNIDPFEEEVADQTGSDDDSQSEYGGSESSKSMGSSHVRRPISSAASPPRVTRSQRAQHAIHAGEALPSSEGNKENRIAVNPSTVAVEKREPPLRSQLGPPPAKARRSSRGHEEQPSAGPSPITLYISASDKRWTHLNVVTRFRTGSQRAQPAPVPSSITIEDLDTQEQLSESDEETKEVPTKRPRSTQDEVKAVQTAARKVSVCGLDGGQCQQALTDDPTSNKQHIKSAHPSRIPQNAGTVSSTTGPLKTRQKGVLSDAEVREEVEKGSLACTWAATPGGTRCGTVCSGKTAQANLAKHVENSHWGREFGCDKCAFKCNTLFSLDRHKEGTHDAIAAAPESEHDNKDAED